MDGSGEQPSLQTTGASEVKVETVEQWKPWNQLHTACEGSGASENAAGDEDTGDDRVDRAPSAPAASSVCAKSKFLPFKEALLYARSLKLKGKEDWEAWRKSGARPACVPSTPDQTHKHDGWQGHGHWLGTGNVGIKKDPAFLPFKQALLYARSLNLKSKDDWKAWGKSGARPDNVPSCPDKVYKHHGWQGHGHWLGTGNAAHKTSSSCRSRRRCCTHTPSS